MVAISTGLESQSVMLALVYAARSSFRRSLHTSSRLHENLVHPTHANQSQPRILELDDDVRGDRDAGGDADGVHPVADRTTRHAVTREQRGGERGDAEHHVDQR